MLTKIIKSGFYSAIAAMICFYIFADLLGNQIILKDAYLLSSETWRNPNLLTKHASRLFKYFGAFILTNTLWSYVFYIRQNTLQGSGIQKGVKFFFLFWLLTVPLHFWFWVSIKYPVEILIYNTFVTHLITLAAIGVVIGKICSEK